MPADFSQLEIGFVVNLGTLREVFKELNVNGRRWWISSDPHDADETGYVTLGYGCRGCYDRLNTLHFRVPVVGYEGSNGRKDGLILMIDPSTVSTEEAGFYLGNGLTMEDPVEDFYTFYSPIEKTLIARLQARN